MYGFCWTSQALWLNIFVSIPAFFWVQNIEKWWKRNVKNALPSFFLFHHLVGQFVWNQSWTKLAQHQAGPEGWKMPISFGQSVTELASGRPNCEQRLRLFELSSIRFCGCHGSNEGQEISYKQTIKLPGKLQHFGGSTCQIGVQIQHKRSANGVQSQRNLFDVKVFFDCSVVDGVPMGLCLELLRLRLGCYQHSTGQGECVMRNGPPRAHDDPQRQVRHTGCGAANNKTS